MKAELTSSHYLSERWQAEDWQSHRERVAIAEAVVDCTEPKAWQLRHLRTYSPKGIWQKDQKQALIDRENARLMQSVTNVMRHNADSPQGGALSGTAPFRSTFNVAGPGYKLGPNQVRVLDTRHPHMPGTLQGRLQLETASNTAYNNMQLFQRLEEWQGFGRTPEAPEQLEKSLAALAHKDNWGFQSHLRRYTPSKSAICSPSTRLDGLTGWMGPPPNMAPFTPVLGARHPSPSHLRSPERTCSPQRTASKAHTGKAAWLSADDAVLPSVKAFADNMVNAALAAEASGQWPPLLRSGTAPTRPGQTLTSSLPALGPRPSTTVAQPTERNGLDQGLPLEASQVSSKEWASSSSFLPDTQERFRLPHTRMAFPLSPLNGTKGGNSRAAARAAWALPTPSDPTTIELVPYTANERPPGATVPEPGANLATDGQIGLRPSNGQGGDDVALAMLGVEDQLDTQWEVSQEGPTSLPLRPLEAYAASHGLSMEFYQGLNGSLPSPARSQNGSNTSSARNRFAWANNLQVQTVSPPTLPITPSATTLPLTTSVTTSPSSSRHPSPSTRRSTSRPVTSSPTHLFTRARTPTASPSIVSQGQGKSTPTSVTNTGPRKATAHTMSTLSKDLPKLHAARQQLHTQAGNRPTTVTTQAKRGQAYAHQLAVPPPNFGLEGTRPLGAEASAQVLGSDAPSTMSIPQPVNSETSALQVEGGVAQERPPDRDGRSGNRAIHQQLGLGHTSKYASHANPTDRPSLTTTAEISEMAMSYLEDGLSTLASSAALPSCHSSANMAMTPREEVFTPRKQVVTPREKAVTPLVKVSVAEQEVLVEPQSTQPVRSPEGPGAHGEDQGAHGAAAIERAEVLVAAMQAQRECAAQIAALHAQQSEAAQAVAVQLQSDRTAEQGIAQQGASQALSERRARQGAAEQGADGAPTEEVGTEQEVQGAAQLAPIEQSAQDWSTAEPLLLPPASPQGQYASDSQAKLTPRVESTTHQELIASPPGSASNLDQVVLPFLLPGEGSITRKETDGLREPAHPASVDRNTQSLMEPGQEGIKERTSNGVTVLPLGQDMLEAALPADKAQPAVAADTDAFTSLDDPSLTLASPSMPLEESQTARPRSAPITAANDEGIAGEGRATQQSTAAQAASKEGVQGEALEQSARGSAQQPSPEQAAGPQQEEQHVYVEQYADTEASGENNTRISYPMDQTPPVLIPSSPALSTHRHSLEITPANPTAVEPLHSHFRVSSEITPAEMDHVDDLIAPAHTLEDAHCSHPHPMLDAHSNHSRSRRSSVVASLDLPDGIDWGLNPSASAHMLADAHSDALLGGRLATVLPTNAAHVEVALAQQRQKLLQNTRTKSRLQISSGGLQLENLHVQLDTTNVAQDASEQGASDAAAGARGGTEQRAAIRGASEQGATGTADEALHFALTPSTSRQGDESPAGEEEDMDESVAEYAATGEMETQQTTSARDPPHTVTEPGDTQTLPTALTKQELAVQAQQDRAEESAALQNQQSQAAQAQRDRTAQAAAVQTEQIQAAQAAAVQAQISRAEQAAARQIQQGQAAQEAAAQAQQIRAEQAAAMQAQRDRSAQAAALQAQLSQAAQAAAVQAQRDRAAQVAAVQAQQAQAAQAAAVQAQQDRTAQAAAMQAQRTQATQEAALQAQQDRTAQAAAMQAQRDRSAQATAVQTQQIQATQEAAVQAQQSQAMLAAALQAQQNQAAHVPQSGEAQPGTASPELSRRASAAASRRANAAAAASRAAAASQAATLATVSSRRNSTAANGPVYGPPAEQDALQGEQRALLSSMYSPARFNHKLQDVSPPVPAELSTLIPVELSSAPDSGQGLGPAHTDRELMAKSGRTDLVSGVLGTGDKEDETPLVTTSAAEQESSPGLETTPMESSPRQPDHGRQQPEQSGVPIRKGLAPGEAAQTVAETGRLPNGEEVAVTPSPDDQTMKASAGESQAPVVPYQESSAAAAEVVMDSDAQVPTPASVPPLTPPPQPAAAPPIEAPVVPPLLRSDSGESQELGGFEFELTNNRFADE